MQTTPFNWPTPPYASYPGSTPWREPELCEVEGINGTRRVCLLLSINMEEETASIQVPPSKVVMPLKFAQFRRITLKNLLQPAQSAATGDFAEILGYRPAVDFQLEWADGTEWKGLSIGHVEIHQGLFLFPAVDALGAVQRAFLPKDSFRNVKYGGHIGKVLVEQNAVTQEQVDEVAKTQEEVRSRKFGDFLVVNQIVSPDQLLHALEEQSRMPMIKIGEALTALGLITETQLGEALQQQRKEKSMPLGELLVGSGLITRQDLQTALARKMGYPVIDVASFPVEAAALKRVPFKLAHRLNIMPLLLRNTTLVIAAEDPSQRKLVDELEFALRGKVMPALAAGSAIREFLPKVYDKHGLEYWVDKGPDPRDEAIAYDIGEEAGKLLHDLQSEHEASIKSLVVEDQAEPVEQNDNSLVKLINTMIIDAKTRGASDIHIETHPGERKVKVRFRRDGVLSVYVELPPSYRSALIARIKIMCDLDISERRKPQDGKIDFAKFSPRHKLELRVATIPTSNGLEDVVMRLLASSTPLPLDKLGMRPLSYELLKDAVSKPYGMVLCVGPTGSGKTTTLHSVLGYLNTPEKKIWTAEDPVEITQPDLRQVQVNAKIDWTFAKALRSFLRADPDVIMVGEIRDEETAHIAIEASLTGHLVLSTLHTNSAAETVIRLLDMGMDPFNFADSLLAVLAQRLLRRICSDCKVSVDATDEQVDEWVRDFLHSFPDECKPTREAVLEDWIGRHGKNGRLQHVYGKGCEKCGDSGLRGRVGVHELMVVSKPVKRLIQTAARPEQLLAAAIATDNMRTLRQDGIEKMLAGLTTIDEVRGNCNA